MQKDIILENTDIQLIQSSDGIYYSHRDTVKLLDTTLYIDFAIGSIFGNIVFFGIENNSTNEPEGIYLIAKKYLFIQENHLTDTSIEENNILFRILLDERIYNTIHLYINDDNTSPLIVYTDTCIFKILFNEDFDITIDKYEPNIQDRKIDSICCYNHIFYIFANSTYDTIMYTMDGHFCIIEEELLPFEYTCHNLIKNNHYLYFTCKKLILEFNIFNKTVNVLLNLNNEYDNHEEIYFKKSIILNNQLYCNLYNINGLIGYIYLDLYNTQPSDIKNITKYISYDEIIHNLKIKTQIQFIYHISYQYIHHYSINYNPSSYIPLKDINVHHSLEHIYNNLNKFKHTFTTIPTTLETSTDISNELNNLFSSSIEVKDSLTNPSFILGLKKTTLHDIQFDWNQFQNPNCYFLSYHQYLPWNKHSTDSLIYILTNDYYQVFVLYKDIKNTINIIRVFEKISIKINKLTEYMILTNNTQALCIHAFTE